MHEVTRCSAPTRSAQSSPRATKDDEVSRATRPAPFLLETDKKRCSSTANSSNLISPSISVSNLLSWVIIL